MECVYVPDQQNFDSLDEAIQYKEELFLKYYKCYAFSHKEIFLKKMKRLAEFLDAARVR